MRGQRVRLLIVVAVGLALAATVVACGTEHTVATGSGSFDQHKETQRLKVTLDAGKVHVTYRVMPHSQAGLWQATLSPMSGPSTNGPAYRWGPFVGSEARKDSTTVPLPGGLYELSIVGREADFSITLAQSD
jgi:hypothetical protein